MAMTALTVDRPSPSGSPLLRFHQPRVRSVILLLVGSVAVVVAAALYAIPALDALSIVAMAGGAGLVAAITGAAALRLAQHRSLGSQIMLVAVFALAGTALGACFSARAMFLSEHDFGVFVLVLVTSCVAVCLSTLVLGRRISRSAEEVISAAQHLDHDHPPVLVRGDQPNELAKVANELRLASERLRNEEERVARKELSRQQLITWVSSDLHAIVANIERLALVDGPTETSEALRDEAERMRRVVDDLLELHGVS